MFDPRWETTRAIVATIFAIATSAIETMTTPRSGSDVAEFADEEGGFGTARTRRRTAAGASETRMVAIP